VDAITEAQPCNLMTQWHHRKVKAAVGSVTPPRPGATFHCLPIPQGYAVVIVDEIEEGFEDLELDHPTGEGENLLECALKTTCLWRKEFIKLPNWTPPPPPPPPASQGTLPNPPPPSPPAPARPSSPPPPPPPQQGRKRATAAPAAPPPRNTPSPPRKQQRKTVAAAPAAPASSSTTSGGRRYKFGPPSLKPLEKLTYEKSDEENVKISKGQVKEFFAKKKPPPEEKIDSVKLKRTLDALKRPPPPPPDDNHVRALKKAVQEARRSGTTSSDKRLQERITSGKKIPQLGEQANQSCPR